MLRIKKIIPGTIYEQLRRAKACIMRGISGTMGIFPIDENKIVFSNFNGRGFGDNPKYLAIEFEKRHRYNMYWIVDEDADFPDYITKIKRGSISCHYHMATARVWIDNARKDPYYKKRKGQFYLQTWHGSLALKKIEKDVEDQIGKYYVESAKRDAEMVDLMIANSNFSEKLFSESFWYSGEIKKFGTPRLDCMFDKRRVKLRDAVRASINIPKDDFLVLYAPTFRNSLATDVYDLDIERIKDAFGQKFDKEVSVIVKLHPNLTLIDTDLDFSGAIDVSNYSDVYELMIAADALITDYSSLMFEFPVADRKPVFCYAKDLETYDRGFYFRISELPYTFAVTNEQLIENIENYDESDYNRRIEAFYAELELLEDGNASERTVEYIESVI